ncbi:hypothetical protein [Streptomyces sp. NPDC096012]|uniref:hypothetical protein n=1 Tax=Streptomyces sp. NPDC096012 TaxID=3155684 RepID=UPI00336AD12C
MRPGTGKPDGRHLAHLHTGTTAPGTVWLRCRARISDIGTGPAARLTAEVPVRHAKEVAVPSSGRSPVDIRLRDRGIPVYPGETARPVLPA